MVEAAKSLEPGIFLQRENRFVGEFKLSTGARDKCHIMNPGRMKEFLVPGAEIFVENRKKNNPKRKLTYSLIYAKENETLIGIDSQLSNAIFEDALVNRKVEPFKKVKEIVREQTYGEEQRSRVDFVLDGTIFVEVKTTNCVIDGIAKFPDAPSTRAQKHIQDLLFERTKGNEIWAVFLVQRADAKALRPYDRIDPKFGALLRDAVTKGLKTKAFLIRYSPGGLNATFGKEIPVLLDPPEEQH